MNQIKTGIGIKWIRVKLIRVKCITVQSIRGKWIKLKKESDLNNQNQSKMKPQRNESVWRLYIIKHNSLSCTPMKWIGVKCIKVKRVRIKWIRLKLIKVKNQREMNH